MKKLIPLFIAACVLFSCNGTVAKNKKLIDNLVQTRAVAKSVTVDSYKIADKVETADSLILYVDVKPTNGQPYADTLRFAKDANGYITTPEIVPQR
jgi:hypothetical protein